MTIQNVSKQQSNPSGEEGVIALEKVTGVYSITCKPSSAVYIGSSGDIHQRIVSHMHQLRSGSHSNVALLRDFELYGASAFECRIVERHDTIADALNAERRLILRQRESTPSYNIAMGGKYKPRKIAADYKILLRNEKNSDLAGALRIWMDANQKSISDLMEGCSLERMRAYRLAAGTVPHVGEMKAIHGWTNGEVDANAIFGLSKPSLSVAA